MIKFWIEKRNRNWVQATACAVLYSFLFTALVAPFAQASVWEERKRAIESVKNEEKIKNAFEANKSLSLNFCPSRVVVPEELGSIVEEWDDGTDSPFPLVIHIQDAHGVYEAQKNAASILKQLVASNEPQVTGQSSLPLMVCVEGAWGRVFTDWISAFPKESVKKELAEDLLSKSEITGEEYFSILQPPGKIQIYGVENREIYDANLKTRRLMNRDRKQILSRLSSIKVRLQRLKNKLYGKKLLELDEASESFRDQKLSLKNYFNYLKKVSPLNWNAGQYPTLLVLSDLLNLEDSISIKGVEDDSKNLMNFLSEKLDKAALLQLIQVNLNFRLGKISAREYYEGLVQMAQANNFPVPQIKSYVKYLKKYQELNSELMFTELFQFEKEVFLKFSEKAQPVEKLILSNWNLEIQEKFWDEKLLPQEWAEYETENGNVGWKQIEAYIKEEEKGMSLRATEGSVAISKDVIASPPTSSADRSARNDERNLADEQAKFLQEAYYKLAIKRNKIMVEKTLEMAREKGQERVVLIAGGFHTPGITRLLRGKGIHYIVVRPSLAVSLVQKSSPEEQGFKKVAKGACGYLREPSNFVVPAGESFRMELFKRLTGAQEGDEKLYSLFKEYVKSLEGLENLDKEDREEIERLIKSRDNKTFFVFVKEKIGIGAIFDRLAAIKPVSKFFSLVVRPITVFKSAFLSIMNSIRSRIIGEGEPANGIKNDMAAIIKALGVPAVLNKIIKVISAQWVNETEKPQLILFDFNGVVRVGSKEIEAAVALRETINGIVNSINERQKENVFVGLVLDTRKLGSVSMQERESIVRKVAENLGVPQKFIKVVAENPQDAIKNISKIPALKEATIRLITSQPKRWSKFVKSGIVQLLKTGLLKTGLDVIFEGKSADIVYNGIKDLGLIDNNKISKDGDKLTIKGVEQDPNLSEKLWKMETVLKIQA